MWSQWKLFEKMTKTLNFDLFWGPKWHQSGPYSTHRWKYLQWACETILMWNQWKLYEKVTRVQNFDLLWGTKWPQNWAFDAHIVHISESSSNEHIKQVSCESSGNFSRKYAKTYILTNFDPILAKPARQFGPQGPYFKHTHIHKRARAHARTHTHAHTHSRTPHTPKSTERQH